MRKSTRLIAGVIVAIGLIFPATAEADAACTWQGSELPLPAGHSYPMLKGVGGQYIVAQTASQVPGIMRWHNGQGTLVGLPTTEPGYYGRPVDVSSNGTVLALLTPLNGGGVDRPYVARPDGTHSFLADVSPGVPGFPVAINGRGDVVGSGYVDGDARIALWTAPDYGPPKIFGMGSPAGIDEAGVIVTATGVKYTASGFAWPLARPAGAEWIVVQRYDNNGIAVGWTQVGDEYRALMWHTNGSVLYSIPDSMGFSANHHGTIVGAGDAGASTKTWRAGQEVPVPVAALHFTAALVTEYDTLVGTYYDSIRGYAFEWSCR